MAWQDIFVGNQPGLSEDDKNQLARGGLLQAGLQGLQAAWSRDPNAGSALVGGLLGGIQSAQQGGQQLVKQRFQQAQMDDQQQQIQRRQQIQDLALRFAKPDGTFDMPGYQSALAQFDPQAAQELHQNELRSKLADLQGQKAQRDLNKPDIRKLEQGNNLLTQEQQPDGSYKTIATAGRFAPQQSAASAFAQKVALIKQYGGTDDDVKRALGIGGADTSQVPTIDSLSPSDKATVQAIVDGRYPVPTGKQAMDPNWQRLIAVAQQVDPTLDAGTYKSRAAARQNFTSGKIGEQVKALNTLAGHLATLNDSLDKLDNSDFSLVNKAANFSASHGNSQRAATLGTYNTAAKAVGDEAAKVFAGGQSALGDRQEIAHGLDPSQPNASLRASLQTYAELVQSRLSALQEQANQSLGYGSKSLQVVTPKAAQTFSKLAGGGHAAPTQSGGGTVDLNAKDPLGLGL